MLYTVKKYGGIRTANPMSKAEVVQALSKFKNAVDYYVTWKEEGVGTQQMNAENFFNEHKDSCPLWHVEHEGKKVFCWTPIEVSEEVERVCLDKGVRSRHVEIMYMTDHMWGNEFMSRLAGNTGHIAEYLK